MHPRERRRKISERVLHKGRQSVEALARAFDVSVETIRRDLIALAAQGRIRKVHGGALAPKLDIETTVYERMGDDIAAKEAIAQRLCMLIRPGETLFMDTGSTTLVAAQALAELDDLTVITNALPVCDVLGRAPGVKVHLLGGAYRSANAQTVGPHCIEHVARFRADRAILTVAAVDETCVMDRDFENAQVARAMCAQSRETVVIASASKFERQAAHTVCRLHELSMLICERAPPPALRATLVDAGVAIHTAPVAGTSRAA